MKKMFMIGLCLLMSQMSRSQGFAQAEYFIDTDPGIGNATAIPMTITNADSVLFNTTISTTGLTGGFHFVGIRMQENSGNWGLFESRGFYISSATANVNNITAAEYYIDVDPGIGNANAIGVGTPGDTVNFTTTISLASLSEGFHHIVVRTRDQAGTWGLFEARGFFISGATTNTGNIIAAEYFIDNDPGIGNGNTVGIGTAGTTVNFAATIPTSSLTEGFHFIAVRTQDAQGHWGLFESRGFYISSATSNVANIVDAEYFIDSDPGVGNATQASVGVSGDTVNFMATVPLSGLPDGFHHIAIRTKDADGSWGLFETRGFYISQSTSNVADSIVAAEYFIDTDPGIGNGSALIITTPDTAINQSFICSTSAGLSPGQHFVFIRVKDNHDIWSLYELDSFIVNGTLAVEGLSLKASRQGSKVSVDWKTITERNSSHFEIEKSKNGVVFEKIGVTDAIGNSTKESHYSYSDATPFPDLSFYRIKQIDIDGSFLYSNIATVLFDLAIPTISVYPNPATDKILVDLPEDATYSIQIFNAQGQMALSKLSGISKHIELDISLLAVGSYKLRISNGVQLYYAQFIRL